jgi:hypothetical protein
VWNGLLTVLNGYSDGIAFALRLHFQLFCQNLSLFGKLFIDIKTLFFDCENCKSPKTLASTLRFVHLTPLQYEQSYSICSPTPIRNVTMSSVSFQR